MIRLVPATRRVAVPAWALCVVVAWGLGVMAYTWLAYRSDGAPPLCHLRRLTGMPCPTCGTTRAVLAAFGGRWLDAVTHNPFMCVAAVMGAAWLIVRLGWGRRVVVSRGTRTAIWITVVTVFLANWAYLVWRA